MQKRRDLQPSCLQILQRWEARHFLGSLGGEISTCYCDSCIHTHASGHNILLSMCAARQPQMRDETSIPENAYYLGVYVTMVNKLYTISLEYSYPIAIVHAL